MSLTWISYRTVSTVRASLICPVQTPVLLSTPELDSPSVNGNSGLDSPSLCKWQLQSPSLSRSKTLEFLTPLLLSQLTSNHSKYSEYEYFLPPLAKLLVLATLFSHLNNLLSALISALASCLFLAQQPKYFLKTSVKPHLSFPSHSE